MRIESLQNEIIKNALLIKDKKYRDEQGLFIVESIKAIAQIPDTFEIEKIFICNDLNNTREKEIYSSVLSKSKEVFEVGEKIIKKLSFAKTPQNIIALVKKKKLNIEEVLKQDGFYIFLENLQDPGNLGTIIRCADAFGASGVFVSKTSADIYGDKVLRSAMGSIFNIAVIAEIDTADFFKLMLKHNIETFAATPHSKNILQNLDMPNKFVVLIGNESRGLSQYALEHSDQNFKIEMPGRAQSLNAAIAGAIIMYEISKSLFKS